MLVYLAAVIPSSRRACCISPKTKASLAAPHVSIGVKVDGLAYGGRLGNCNML